MDDAAIVTLTTDFGLDDSYVGQMKGAIATVAPRSPIVDLTHAVPPGDVAAGAWLLETAYGAFPEGTVHVVVVDPGVGTDRLALAAIAGGHRFVGPDNGVLSRALRAAGSPVVHRIAGSDKMPGHRSATFHGRDLFAPVGAGLSRGRRLAEVGPPVSGWVELPGPVAGLRRGEAREVPVVWIDRFGNVALDLRVPEIEEALGGPFGPGSEISLFFGDSLVERVCRTFGDARNRDPFLIRNSSDYLEIACRDRAADRALGLRRGATVRVKIG